MTRVSLFFGKTLRDSTRPKLLLVVLIPYLGIAALISALLTAGLAEDFALLPLGAQEQGLLELYTQLAFVWLIAFPMVYIAVLAAMAVAGEAERGTLRILLSKPLNRYEPLLGKFLGITVAGLILMLVGLVGGAALLVIQADTSAMAISGGILSIIPAFVVFGLLVALFTASIGTLVGVVTGSRLKTVVLTTLIPVVFFVFTFLKLLTPGDFYERYYLFVVDLNYHFGNAFFVLNDLLGPAFTPATQNVFADVSGVFDTAAVWHDPLLGGIVGSVPLAEYVPPWLSLAVLVLVTIACLGVAIVQFGRMDIL